MSQARHQAIKDIADRAGSYGVPGVAVDGNDVMAVYEAAKEGIARARKGLGPTLIECKTYRHRGHFEGDPGTYKPTEEQKSWLEKDPIPRFRDFLKKNGVMSEDEISKIDGSVTDAIKEAVRFAEESPDPDPASVVVDVYSDIIEEVRVR
jgi:pyruvate dehydrogenase E1 component alpha subunit